MSTTHKFDVAPTWWTKLGKTKHIEGRKATGKFGKFQIGDYAQIYPTGLENFNPKLFLIKDIRYYGSCYEYLLQEGLAKTLPGVTSIVDGVQVFLDCGYSYEEIKGPFLAIELEEM